MSQVWVWTWPRPGPTPVDPVQWGPGSGPEKMSWTWPRLDLGQSSYNLQKAQQEGWRWQKQAQMMPDTLFGPCEFFSPLSLCFLILTNVLLYIGCNLRNIQQGGWQLWKEAQTTSVARAQAELISKNGYTVPNKITKILEIFYRIEVLKC